MLVHNGWILDGINRVEAVHLLRHRDRLNIELKTEEYTGPSDPATLAQVVVSKNLIRRHLAPGQRAAIAAEVLPAYEARAKERLKTRRHIPQGLQPTDPDIRARLQEKVEQIEEGEARAIVAIQLGVSTTYVSLAKRLQKESPEIFKKVKAGDLTMPDAVKRAKLRPKKSATETEAEAIEQQRIWTSAAKAAGHVVEELMALDGRKVKVTEGLKYARQLEAFIRRSKPKSKGKSR